MPRSAHGGRHELGQNFLVHRPTIDLLTALAASTRGPILEIGAGDGALTRPLSALGRPVTAIEIDEHRVRRLRRALPGVRVVHADALRHPLSAPVVVGNVPFHLTTPILRRLLTTGTWEQAFLLTQWEVARKRAGVGGGTILTAQAAPWFDASLHGRVPARGFSPRPGVDGGVLGLVRRATPLVDPARRPSYERFVRSVFVARGAGLARMLTHAAPLGPAQARRTLARAGIGERALPRDLSPEQWASLWESAKGDRPPRDGS
ncbi:23S ribosomal RNA methyltransferase Erm [Microbacterium sp. gxy059]|uniref:23S ribosomal RNA methyltransferase Erm n=1 Tax=Microbacterium sp. gxy059 TaxID=2957199 RepID=UPI003D981858